MELNREELLLNLKATNELLEVNEWIIAEIPNMKVKKEYIDESLGCGPALLQLSKCGIYTEIAIFLIFLCFHDFFFDMDSWTSMFVLFGAAFGGPVIVWIIYYGYIHDHIHGTSKKKAEFDQEQQRIWEGNQPKIVAYEKVIEYNYQLIAQYSVVPGDYMNPEIIIKLIEYIKNLRADNIKEALNLFEREAIFSEDMRNMKQKHTEHRNIINQKREILNTTPSIDEQEWRKVIEEL